jgi:hypothetical protein
MGFRSAPRLRGRLCRIVLSSHRWSAAVLLAERCGAGEPPEDILGARFGTLAEDNRTTKRSTIRPSKVQRMGQPQPVWCSVLMPMVALVSCWTRLMPHFRGSAAKVVPSQQRMQQRAMTDLRAEPPALLSAHHSPNGTAARRERSPPLPGGRSVPITRDQGRDGVAPKCRLRVGRPRFDGFSRRRRRRRLACLTCPNPHRGRDQNPVSAPPSQTGRPSTLR